MHGLLLAVLFCSAARGQDQLGGACATCQPGYRRAGASSPGANDSNVSASASWDDSSGGDNGGPMATCLPCPVGRVSLAGEACRSCSQGSVPNLDRSGCTECVGGEQPNLDRSDCVQCAPGFVSNRSSSCSACPAGRFSAADNSFCDRCPAGFQANGTGCVQCGPGEYTTEQGFCHRCPESQVAARAAGGGCQPCEPGSQPNELQTACIACGPGGNSSRRPADFDRTMSGASLPMTADSSAPSAEYSTLRGFCHLCANGTVALTSGSDLLGSSSCQTCPPGRAPDSSRVACRSCPPGQFAPFAADCRKCLAGSHSDEAGASECEVCTPGKAPDTNQTTCQCEAGYFDGALYEGFDGGKAANNSVDLAGCFKCDSTNIKKLVAAQCKDSPDSCEPNPAVHIVCLGGKVRHPILNTCPNTRAAWRHPWVVSVALPARQDGRPAIIHPRPGYWVSGGAGGPERFAVYSCIPKDICLGVPTADPEDERSQAVTISEDCRCPPPDRATWRRILSGYSPTACCIIVFAICYPAHGIPHCM